MANSKTDLTRATARRRAALLLIAGTLAWIVVLVAVLLALLHDEQTRPQPTPVRAAQRPTLAAATSTPLPSATPGVLFTPLASATPAPTLTPAPTVTPLATATAAGPESPMTPAESTAAAGCAPPAGWEHYVVQPDDTLFAFVLGANGTVTVDDLLAANCLSSRLLQIGQVLYLPPGAAENAPPSAPAAAVSAGASGPRAPNCPCTIRVTEGWRREQIADAINAAQTMFTGADFLAVTGPGASAPFDFVMERPAGTSMEGYLLPGTYAAQNDTTAEGFRDLLLAGFAANVSPQIRADAAAQGVSFYQALIIASIVQREVRGPETQKLAASVYYNRYRDGNRLASTISIQYALGRPGNWWPRITSALAEADTPYNTWTRPGLPPTPVDNPGLSAIIAAVYPAQTNYYYHTAACDGSGEVFAATYEEHLRNANCEN